MNKIYVKYFSYTKFLDSLLRWNDNFLQVRHKRLMKSPDIQLPDANSS